ncbi:MAG: beta-propeller fold lactonase family protein [Phycisphaerae bacterium]|jgi:YVTN family beta-propeller protein|nr:beta-propeller fold lactonase family protein [Phycisphaerae bacterium]
MMKERAVKILSFLLLSIVLGGWMFASSQTPAVKYHSPLSLAISPDGKTLYASDPTFGGVAVLDAAGKTAPRIVALKGVPRGLAISGDGKSLYVAQRGVGTIAVIDTAKASVTSEIPVGRWPEAVAVADKSKRLYVCNQDSHSVSVIDLSTGKGIKEIPVVREPSSAAVTPDEKHVVVTNFMPHGVGTDINLGAVVSIIDAGKLAVASTVKLPAGSTAVYGVCVSPDGKWAYAVHQIGRFNQPISQLELGWVNTYGLSIIDIAKRSRLATVLLDDLEQGAATPHDVVCSKDGKQLWISHAGVHEVSNVKIGVVHELLQGKIPKNLAKIRDGSMPDSEPEKGHRGKDPIPDEVLVARSEANIWVRIKADPKNTHKLTNDLTALYLAGAIRRFSTGGNSPRGIVLSPDEKRLFIANYYTGSIAVMETADGKLGAPIPLGPQPKPSNVRRGEILFHDATYCFQRWQSCATCHQGGGRIDGLRWDFLRDGIGNPKDTPSLIAMGKTAPFNRLATRKTPRECTRTGVIGSHQIDPTAQEVDDLLAYCLSLKPEASPHLTIEGKLTESAVRGKAIFEGKADCAKCHSGPLYTDLKQYDVGAATPNDPKSYKGLYDTPSLLEVHRTAPYLHDGRAMTLKDVLTAHNKNDQHGKVKGLKPAELVDLIEYLRSL